MDLKMQFRSMMRRLYIAAMEPEAAADDASTAKTLRVNLFMT